MKKKKKNFFKFNFQKKNKTKKNLDFVQNNPQIESTFLQEIKKFVALNSNSAFQEDLEKKNGDDYFGVVWNGPPIQLSCQSQTSALDLFLTQLFLKK